MRRILIAIDGPAGSGKSTTAKLVARKLGYIYLDTGAMYRAITLKALTSHIDLSNEEEISGLAHNSNIAFLNNDGTSSRGARIILDGNDMTEKIREEEVTKNVSLVSSYPGVRKVLVDKQREIGSQKSCVVEGRDIGTVVFPDADLKFFMIADVMERARRRQAELSQSGAELPILQVVRELKERDMKDSMREASPLRKADDAVEIDTTNLTIDEQVEKILSYVGRTIATMEEVEKK